MPRFARRVVGLALVVFWVSVFISTHVPSPDLGDLPKHSDKFMHFVAYACLSFLLGLWRAAWRPMTFRDYATVFGITAAYGVVDELLQAIPILNRSCDPVDALADWCGSLIGLVLVFAALRIYRWGFTR